MAKSLDSALVGVAIDEDKIASVRDPITKCLPELAKRDPRFASITIRDLLQLSAGIRYNEDPPYHDDDVTYRGADLRRAALENTAIVDPPGKYFLYNDYHPIQIGLILERATAEPGCRFFLLLATIIYISGGETIVRAAKVIFTPRAIEAKSFTSRRKKGWSLSAPDSILGFPRGAGCACSGN